MTIECSGNMFKFPVKSGYNFVFKFMFILGLLDLKTTL